MLECAAHRLRAAEATLFCDQFNGLRRLFESPPRCFDADLQNEARGCHADLLGEDAREIALAHPDSRGHLLDG